MKTEVKITNAVKIITLNLTMSEREARALFAIVERVGGYYLGPRSVADKIRRELAAPLSASKHSFRSFGAILLPDSWDEFKKAPSE